MGRNSTYSEDLLTDAVFKYAEIYAGTIQITKLAAWASVNVDGLQGVKNYHFTKNIIEKDPVTGKKKARKKLCLEHIEAINKSRSLTSRASTNLILRSSNPNKFLDLPRAAQLKTILEAKELFNSIEKRNAELLRNNRALTAVNDACEEKYKEIDVKLKAIEKKLKQCDRITNYVLKNTDLENRKKMLEEIGVKGDANFDILKYRDSLSLDVKDVFDINKTIAAFFEENTTSHEDMMDFAELHDSMMEVFDELDN